MLYRLLTNGKYKIKGGCKDLQKCLEQFSRIFKLHKEKFFFACKCCTLRGSSYNIFFASVCLFVCPFQTPERLQSTGRVIAYFEALDEQVWRLTMNIYGHQTRLRNERKTIPSHALVWAKKFFFDNQIKWGVILKLRV